MTCVAHVVQRYPRLSQTFVTNEVDELRRQGVDVEVVALFPGDFDAGPVTVLSETFLDARACRDADRRLLLRHPVRWLAFRRAVRELRSEMGAQDDQVEWRKLPALAEVLAGRGVDVLHAHFAWNGAAAAMCLSKILGVPWSVTLHAKDVFSRLRNLEAKLRDADELVTVCEYNERWLREHRGLSRPVHRVVCGVALPDAGERRPPEVDVVGVGRLVPKKGFDVLLDAVAKLRVERPALRVEIIGDGGQRAALEQQAADVGVDDVVMFRGALAHDETLDRIASARVFCLPCRVAEDGDRDSMPVVIKEAMARQVPVVASGVVAVPEMVDDTCGVLVPPDDPAALAAALARMLDDPGDRGAAGRARVEERFTLTGEVAKLRRLFEDMAAR